MDHAINVLMIQDLGGGPCQGLLASMRATPMGSDEPGLRIFAVPSLKEAASHLRQGRVDAILLDQNEAAGIARLQASATDLPILLIAGDDGIDDACSAIGAGAEDVLLPADLAPETLRRRIALAIARKAFERHRLRHAREDVLTGLANSALIEERFIRALARADRYATLVGLVAIDLDGFDVVTSRHGQEVADRLLSMVAKRLQSETRQTDTLARTRIHGFTWLVESLPTVGDINTLVNRLPQQLARPFSIDDQDIHLTASVGVAVCPFHGRDFQTVHGMAEAAMLDVSTINGDALLMLPVSQPMRSAALT